MKLLTILTVAASLIAFGAFPQESEAPVFDDPPLRVEIPAKSDKETYRVIPCGKTGLVMFYKGLDIVDETRVKWYFSFYDRNLQPVWTKGIPLPGQHEYRLSSFENDTLSLLFTAEGKNKGPDPDYQVVRVLLHKGTFILNRGDLPDDASPAAFKVTGQKAWIAVNVKGESGKILFVDLPSNRVKPIMLGEGAVLRLRWFRPDSSNAFATAIVTRQVSKKVNEHYLVRYDTTGTIASEAFLSPQGQGRDFTGFRLFPTGEGSDLIAGCYGQGNGGGSGNSSHALETSTGFFAGVTSGKTTRGLSFYNILELKSVGSLLSEKDIIDLRKKALKKNKNISEYSVDFQLLLHEVFRHNNEFVLMGEVVVPQYHTENYTEFDYYGRPYTNSYSVFDGYRFLNAIAAGFDSTGKLLWDNTLEIRNLLSYELNPKVSVFPSGENLVMCYLGDGKIGSKVIKGMETIEKLEFSPVELQYPDDRLVSETRNRMVPWYDHYFLCYGYQEIKNIALSDNNRRIVYYFSKVGFEQ